MFNNPFTQSSSFHFSLFTLFLYCSLLQLCQYFASTSHNYIDSNQQILKYVIIINMQSSDTPLQPQFGGNAKVYISNINKSIDQETLRKKFEEFGIIRSCILKKKLNDVTYSFIQYQKPADAALAIAKLNGTEVWERNLKVQYGLGGKKGFQHYMTDAERDRKFGQNRRRRDDSVDSHDRIRKSHHHQYRGQYRRRSYSRDSRHSESYSPGLRRRENQRRKQRRRPSYSRDSQESYYKNRQYRQRQRRQHKKRRSSSRSNDRRRSREKNRGYYEPYKHENYSRERRDYQRQNYKRYNKNRSRSRQGYVPQKKHSPDFKLKKYSRQSSEKRHRYQRSERYQKRTEGRYDKQRERERQKKPEERYLGQRKQSFKDENKKRQKYEPSSKDKDIRIEKSFSYKQQLKYRRERQSSQKNGENTQRRNYGNGKESYNRNQSDYTSTNNLRKYEDINEENEKTNKYKNRD